MPLEGLRVIDLGQVFAGPLAGRILADMGAEVIRVESAVRSGRGGLQPQAGAVYPDGEPGSKPYNRSAYYNELNRNKLAVSLDLSKEKGREIFKRLVEISDVLIENFSPRVMANFGLGYPALKQIKPDIIMASISGYGQTGPYRDYVSFGRGIEAMSGLSDLTGYEDSGPIGPGIAYADANAGKHAAFAVLAALRVRRRTGQGRHIDLSLRESLTALLGPQVIDNQINPRTVVRRGNRDSSAVFQGCYRCRGDDSWIAVAVESNQEWESLCGVVGIPDDTARSLSYQVRDTLFFKGGGPDCYATDGLIEAWTLKHEAADAMFFLQQAGVRAGVVNGAVELLRDPHLAARGFFETATHPEAGTYPHPGIPWKLSRTPGRIYRPAPCFAQHNRYVFGELLGISLAELMELEGEGVIASAPAR